MARVVACGRRGAMDPIKHSQSLGGVLALLGVDRCMPLLHGAQGCAAFAKALLTRHFREPVPVQTSALTEVSTVLGSTDSLLSAIDTVTRRHRPEVIGVLTTAVTETSGEDLDGALRAYRELAAGTADRPLLVSARTPDFTGGLSDGWASTLTALVTSALPGDRAGPRPAGTARRPGTDPGLVAVPTGLSLSAVDLDELADLIRAFGLSPLLVPDLSRSLDGHLAEAWSPLTTGGTSAADLARLPTAGCVLALGASGAPAGAALAAATGAPLRAFDHCTGLATVDALVGELARLGDRPVPEPVRHWRRRLADGLLDSHFVLGGARVAIAAEPEYLAAVATLLAEAGARVVAAVSPTPARVLERVPCDEVAVGDLVELADRATEAGAELVIAGSHARDLSRRLGLAHLTAGFPVLDRLGAQLHGSSGYRGSLHLLFEAANHLLEHRDHGPAHRPPAGPGTRHEEREEEAPC